MVEIKKRTKRTLSDGKTLVRKTISLFLSPEHAERFIKESNYGEFLSNLVEEHYDETVVKVPIDDKIKEAYENDPYKEYLIPVLLLNHYLNGGANSIQLQSPSSAATKKETIVSEHKNHKQHESINKTSSINVNEELESSSKDLEKIDYVLNNNNDNTNKLVVEEEVIDSNEIINTGEEILIPEDKINDTQNVEVEENINTSSEKENMEKNNDEDKKKKTITPGFGTIDELIPHSNNKNLLS